MEVITDCVEGSKKPSVAIIGGLALGVGLEVAMLIMSSGKSYVLESIVGNDFLPMVLTMEEFKIGYVDAEKIYNIPYMLNTPKGRAKNPDFLNEVAFACSKEDHIVVGCQSGVRSLYAVVDLQNVGYKYLSNMGGDYLAWMEKHFPVVKLEDVDQKKAKAVEEKKAEAVELKKAEAVEQRKGKAVE